MWLYYTRTICHAMHWGSAERKLGILRCGSSEHACNTQENYYTRCYGAALSANDVTSAVVGTSSSLRNEMLNSMLALHLFVHKHVRHPLVYV